MISDEVAYIILLIRANLPFVRLPGNSINPGLLCRVPGG